MAYFCSHACKFDCKHKEINKYSIIENREYTHNVNSFNIIKAVSFFDINNNLISIQYTQ